MDQIYSRIKRLRTAPYRRVVSGERLFDVDVPNPDSHAEYDPSTMLDEDEWHKISGFKERDFCLPVLQTGLTSADVPELEKHQFEKMAFLMSIQDGDYYFQRVRPAALIRRKSIVFGDAASIERPSNRLVINPLPDAIFIAESDVLLFRDLAAITPIFTGIDELFREATDAQVEEFLSHDFIATEIEPSAVSKPNRKRIALAMDSLGKFSATEREEVIAYICDYSRDRLQFDIGTGVFTVSNEDELKMLVYGIEQRFYTTTVGSERRLANSVSTI
jgi:hypothetical protein